MENIAGNTGFATPIFRLPLNLQLFADGDDGTPNLEDDPDYASDVREYEQMDAKIEKFTAERTSKETVKETDTKTEKEPAKADDDAGTKEVATPNDKPKQDKETNDAFQEQRKAREAAEAKAKVLEDKAAKADALIKAQFGNQGINTVEQYEQWIRDGEIQAETDRYTDAGLTPEEIEKLRDYDTLKAEVTNRTVTEIQQESSKQWGALYNAYPEVEEAIVKFNKGEAQTIFNAEMQAEIARGASPLAAYRNVHFETILANATKSVKETATQDAVDRINSKSHIKGNAQAAGDIDHYEVDPEQMKIYRGLMKGKSDAEIRKFAKKQNAGG